MNELESQVRNLLNGIPPDIKTFSERIAFNCLPLIGAPDEDGVTEEERKIVRETRRILWTSGSPSHGHGGACARSSSVTRSRSMLSSMVTSTPEAAAQAMADHPGVLVTDRESFLATPTTADIAGEDMVSSDVYDEIPLGRWVCLLGGKRQPSQGRSAQRRTNCRKPDSARSYRGRHHR